MRDATASSQWPTSRAIVQMSARSAVQICFTRLADRRAYSRRVHCIFERFASTELHRCHCCDRDLCTRRRISAGPSGTLPLRERAKTDELHGAALADSARDGVQYGLNCFSGGSLAKTSIRRDSVNEFLLVHESPSFDESDVNPTALSDAGANTHRNRNAAVLLTISPNTEVRSAVARR